MPTFPSKYAPQDWVQYSKIIHHQVILTGGSGWVKVFGTDLNRIHVEVCDSGSQSTGQSANFSTLLAVLTPGQPASSSGIKIVGKGFGGMNLEMSWQQDSFNLHNELWVQNANMSQWGVYVQETIFWWPQEIDTCQSPKPQCSPVPLRQTPPDHLQDYLQRIRQLTFADLCRPKSCSCPDSPHNPPNLT